MMKTVKQPEIMTPPLPEIDDATRREFLIGAASLLVFAPYGCGGAGGEEGVASGETRAVEHVLGMAKVPADPRRVVVMDGEITLDPVVALGVEPVAAARPNVTGDIPEQIRDRLDGKLEKIGMASEPSIEKIATLNPDLIIGSPDYLENIHDRLSEIAPTVAVEDEQTVWKERLHEIGTVLGREARAERLLSDYDERTRSFREAMGEKLDGITVTIARATELGFRYLTTNGSFPWTVLADAGLRQPPEQKTGAVGEPFVEISFEQIPIMEADYVFLAVDEGDNSVVEQLESNSLWRGLKGEKIAVSSLRWVFGSVLTANAILDDLEKYVLEGR
jgi:iron complex transport system substrate-binding protein